MTDQILVRLAAEITIKSSRTRASFMRQLTRNMRDALRTAGVTHRIDHIWGRTYVTADPARAVPVLSRVFGISSLSVIEERVPAVRGG